MGEGAGIIALEVMAGHSDRLVAAIVHDPPVMRLPSEDSPGRQEIVNIGRLAVEKSPMRPYIAFGVMTAPNVPKLFRSTAGQIGLAGASRVALAAGSAVRRFSGNRPSTMTRQLGNAELLLNRELPLFGFDYRSDVGALCKAEVPWHLAIGQRAVPRLHRNSRAEIGDSVCAEFPSGHVAYVVQPGEFAVRLFQLFDEMTS